jgi:hypothetical protein
VRLLKQIIAVTPPKSLQPLVLSALKLQGKLVDGVIALLDSIKKGADPLKAYNAAKPTLDKLKQSGQRRLAKGRPERLRRVVRNPQLKRGWRACGAVRMRWRA